MEIQLQSTNFPSYQIKEGAKTKKIDGENFQIPEAIPTVRQFVESWNLFVVSLLRQMLKQESRIPNFRRKFPTETKLLDDREMMFVVSFLEESVLRRSSPVNRRVLRRAYRWSKHKRRRKPDENNAKLVIQTLTYFKPVSLLATSTVIVYQCSSDLCYAPASHSSIQFQL